VGEPLTFVGVGFALVGKTLALVGDLIALVGEILAPLQFGVAPLVGSGGLIVALVGRVCTALAVHTFDSRPSVGPRQLPCSWNCARMASLSITDQTSAIRRFSKR